MSLMDELVKKVNKEFKSNLLSFGLPEYDYERVPFTSPRLNYMSYGGLPLGKMVEFFGDNGSGKTTTALDVVANYQKMNTGKKAFYCDCENTLDTVWATKLGVDVSNMYIFKPENQSAEEIFQMMLDAIETDEIGIVVIDSIGVMVSQQSMEKEIGEKTYAGISGALTTFSGKAVMACKKHNCLFIGINQVRDILNSTWGGIRTPGGNSWKHNVIARFEFRKGDYIDEKGGKLTRSAENPSGNQVLVHMVKNKTCPPNRKTGFYTLRYLTGIDYLADLIELAIKYNIIEKHGAWFTIVDIDTGEVIADKMQGQASVVNFLNENTEIIDIVQKLVDKCMNE